MDDEKKLRQRPPTTARPGWPRRWTKEQVRLALILCLLAFFSASHILYPHHPGAAAPPIVDSSQSLEDGRFDDAPPFGLGKTLEETRLILASTPRDRPLGISLGATVLTATYFDASDRPVHVAKVDAPVRWTRLAQRLSEHRGFEQLCIRGAANARVGGCIPQRQAFRQAMTEVVTAAASYLGRTPVIGHVVVPHNGSVGLLSELYQETIHNFATEIVETPSNEDGAGFITHMEAVRTAFNLSYPENLGLERKPGSRHGWTAHNAVDAEEFAANPMKSYTLLVNYEAGYLEVMSVCLAWYGDCAHVLESTARPTAVPSLGETGLRNTTQSDEEAAENIARFLDDYHRLRMPRSSNLQAVVLAGGAEEMTVAQKAVARAFDFLPGDRIKTLPDPAFVFSLGAAATNRRLQIKQDRRWAYCDESMEERQLHGYPTDDEWPCNLRW